MCRDGYCLANAAAVTMSKGVQTVLLARHVTAGGGVSGATINTNKSKDDVDNNSKSLNKSFFSISIRDVNDERNDVVLSTLMMTTMNTNWIQKKYTQPA